MAADEDRHAVRREKSIERLMQAALDMLKEKSYSAVRVEDITGRAGMAKGSLYMYFEGKDDLYLKAVREFFLKPMKGEFEEILKDRDSGKVLLAIVNYSFEAALHKDEFELLFRAMMDKSLLDLVREEMQSFLDSYLVCTEKHFEAIGWKNPSQASYLFFVMLDGLISYRFLQIAGEEHWSSQAAVERLRKEVLRIFDLELNSERVPRGLPRG